MKGTRWFVVGLLVAIGAGCGEKDECTAGVTSPCTCSNGDPGTQLCRSDRTYAMCNCEGIDAQTGSGEVFVINAGDTSIRVFSRAGLVPIRTLRGGNTGLGEPVAIDVDPVHGEIYVANAADDSVTVYPIGADGNVAPIRRIAGDLTGLRIDPINSIYPGTHGLNVDTTHDEIVVMAYQNDASIRTFSRTATGNVAPLRTIAGGNTTLTILSYGLHVDEVNNEILAITTNPTDGKLLAFSRTADGDVGPLRTLTLNYVYVDVAVDHSNNELLVLQKNSGVEAYARTAIGSATPLRMVTNQGGHAMYFNPAQNEIGVAQSSAIRVNSAATGAELATTSGLSGASSIAFAP